MRISNVLATCKLYFKLLRKSFLHSYEKAQVNLLHIIIVVLIKIRKSNMLSLIKTKPVIANNKKEITTWIPGV